MTRAELMQATLIALATPPRKVPKPPPAYLTFYRPEGEFTLKVYNNTKNWDGMLEWSADTVAWTEWQGTTTLSSSGGYLYLRGTDNTKITGSVAYDGRWVFSYGLIECIGNIENLLDYTTVEAGEHPVMADRCYTGLFAYSYLVTPPEIPATTLTNHCYDFMFAYSSLNTPPELPAITLASSCYSEMFYYCRTLRTAPALPADTLTSYCYDSMFFGCKTLTTAPLLPATTLASGCYRSMFRDCTALITPPPELPAATLENNCYEAMFRNCTALTTAPRLPANTLAKQCYVSMFRDCTALITPPVLPATALEVYCYEAMFRNCASLGFSETNSEAYPYPYRIPTSGMGTTATGAMNNMFTDTGGPFTGTPTINTTYYTDHAPV